MSEQQIPSARTTSETSAPATLDRPVMFLHIPKTAGTSFIGTLRNVFGHDRLVRLVAIDESSPGEIGRLLSERPGGLACLAGHIPFHMIAPWKDRCAIFTILRDPIARVMSLFRFLQQRDPAEQRRVGLQAGFTFNDFITSRHPELFGQIHDGMTRMLCGDARLSSPASSLFWTTTPSAPAITAALHTLQGTDFGIAEDMRNTMRTARTAWGIPYELDTGRENVTNPTGAAPEIEQCLEIVARNAMDRVLYQRAAGLFASRCARLDTMPTATQAGSAILAACLGQEVTIGSVPGLQGFHDVEPEGFAWLDSAQSARIHFELDAPAARIRLRGHAIRADYPIDEVVVEVNGARVATRANPMGNCWFTLETDPVALRRPFNVLSIRPPYFVPVRHNFPDSGDPRSLSISLAKLSFEA